jgi:hypothetical protein
MSEREGYVYQGTTKKQREYIYERDGVENPEEYEVHHIIPVAYAIALLGMTREQVNDPYNLIALPYDEHRAIHKPPHEVRGWKDRQEKYWHDERDEELKEIAAIRQFILEEQQKEQGV